MWIRNQKETKLIKVNNFRVIVSGSYSFKYPYCIETIIENYSIYLGEYSTMKKALKVLDYLQIHLLDLENARNNNFALNNYVFQMPQDDEVEDDE